MIINKLPDILKANNISRYRLAQKSGINDRKLYSIVSRRYPTSVNFEALDSILMALHMMTGIDFDVTDIYQKEVL